MAISITNTISNGDTTDRGAADPYTLASATYDVGTLYVLGIVAEQTDTTPTPTVALTGMTWSLVVKVSYNDNTTPDDGLCVFTGTVDGGSPVTGSVTAEYASTMEGCRWTMNAVTGHNAAAPIVQHPSARIVGNTAFSVGMSAFADATNNAMFCVVGMNSNDAINKEAAHTQLSDGTTAVAAGTLHLKAVWQIGEDTSVAFTTASNRNWGGIAVEIAAAGGGGPNVAVIDAPRRAQMMEA